VTAGGAWKAILAALTPARRRIAALELRAEAAYSAMYDASGHVAAKEAYEDASSFYAEAIRVAIRGRFYDTAERLKTRLEHITNVYNHQFRYVGR
jgi:hypothetical protein